MPAANPWYAPGLTFACTQCGNCCSGPPGYVWFTDAEAAAIAGFLKITVPELRLRYAEIYDKHWSLKDHLTPHGYDCVFLRRDATNQGACAIYAVRPQQCRTWPFWPDNLKNRGTWERAAVRCPGLTAGIQGQGKFYPVDQIRIIRDGKSRGEN